MNCPVCENPIEPKTVIACKRCFALFPRKEQQRLRELYVRGHNYSGKVEKMVRLTREKHPETNPHFGPGLTRIANDLPLTPQQTEAVDRVVINAVEYP